MIRAILLFGGLFVALLFVDRSLAEDARILRETRTRVGFLLPEERRANLPVAAVKIDVPGEGEHFYARVKGRWRAISYRRAEVDADRMAKLFAAIAEAQGTIVTESPDEAQDYGIAGGRSILVSLCGTKVLDDPSGDVLEAFELGTSLGERGASFIRRRGYPAVWNVESDPRALLEARVTDGAPPLLVSQAISPSWAGWQKGLVQIFIDRADGTGYELVRRMRDPETDPPAQGEMPWRWIVAPGGVQLEFASAPAPIRGFELFLRKTPIRDVMDATTTATALADPVARLTLVAPETPPLTVVIGAPNTDGHVLVGVPSLERLVEVEARVAKLLLPGADWFSPDDPQNPWDPYIRDDATSPFPR